MSRLKRLIVEIHHRSLWQVLLIYVGVSWGVLEAADLFIGRLGLADWLFWVALGLLIAGLVVLMVLTFLPEPAVSPTEPHELYISGGRRRHLLTWRRAATIFVLALAAWGVVATGWLLFGRGAEEDAAAGDRPSIAVLPLVNRSGLEDDRYFTDGIHDEILTQLSKISGLSIRGRTSVMQYRDSPKNLRQIGEELNARYLLEGGVQRAGKTVRINVQLIDSETDEHVFADTYDRELSLENVLAIQRGVALRIADALKTTLTAQEREHIERVPTENPEAYDYYLKGRYHLVKMSVAGANSAIEYFEEAIESDSTYAAPYAGLAIAWLLLGQPLGAVRHSEAMPRSKAAAEKALSLDPDLAEAYSILGHVSFVYDWDWQTAERLLERAIQLDPNSPMAHHAYGVYLADAVARYEEGIAEGLRAVELDPLSLFYRAGLAEFYLAARQYDRALEEAQKVLDMDPDYDRARGVIMWVYEELGMCERYLALRREGLMGSCAEPQALARQAALELACADSGFVAIWRWRLERRLERIAAGEYVHPSALAEDYARIGRMDEAIEWLGRAYDERDGNLAFIKMSPAYDGLRSDPRFQDLLRRMSFPE